MAGVPPSTLQHVAERHYICRGLDIVTPEDPYPIWNGDGEELIIAPLFLLYDYSFREANATKEQTLRRAAEASTVCSDEFLLHPDPYPSREAWCRASNAVALDAGLVLEQYHEAVVDSLVEAVRSFDSRIGVGSPALGPLFRALHAAGRDDVIYDMVVNPESPGYAFLVNSGRTTLTEDFSGRGSQDHHFLGQVASWFVHDLAGIQQAPGSIAYDSLAIRPALVGDVEHASATYTTPQGTASSSWTRDDDGKLRRLDVTIPANTPAQVHVPASSPDETFRAVGNADVQLLGFQDGAQVYEVGAGHATFLPA